MTFSPQDGIFADNLGINVYALETSRLQRRLIGGPEQDNFHYPVTDVYEGTFDLAREVLERGGGKP